MQRPIKFRAFDKDTSEWIKHFEVGNDDCGTKVRKTLYKKNSIECKSYPSAKLMQYTGLKDKNGREIYCSDIVKGTFDVGSVEDYVYLSLSEEDQENGYKLFTIPDDIVEFARMSLPDDLEIVGNIYENKDLLE